MDNLDTTPQEKVISPLFDALARFGERYGEDYTLVEKLQDGSKEFLQKVMEGEVDELDSPEAKHLAMIYFDQKFNNK